MTVQEAINLLSKQNPQADLVVSFPDPQFDGRDHGPIEEIYDKGGDVILWVGV